MKPLRGLVWAGALWLLAAGTNAYAGWNNVFEVCCFSCQKPVVSYYAPNPCCDPCPKPTCTTQYVQRCYYEPVTSYETRSYYEPVTSYRTSYYWEPVTSYRYVSYYDPCSCGCRQVAVATTNYQLRSQCCPVQNWVQRCYQVAVTNYRARSYYEPVTSCNYPAPAVRTTPEPPPGVTTTPSSPGTIPPPGVSEQRTPSTGTKYYPQNPNIQVPSAQGSSLRQAPSRLPVIPPAPVPVRQPPVKLDRIVALPGATVHGELVNRDNRPVGKAQFILVSATKQEQPVTTDATGHFRAVVTPGAWFVYMASQDGKRVLHSRIDVEDNENLGMTLVSR